MLQVVILVPLILILLYLLLDKFTLDKIGVTLKDLLESIRLLSDLQATNKHKQIELWVNSIKSVLETDKPMLKLLREDINRNIDIIDRIPQIILSREEVEIRDSLLQSSTALMKLIYGI